jgi:hypothetical protein
MCGKMKKKPPSAEYILEMERNNKTCTFVNKHCLYISDLPPVNCGQIVHANAGYFLEAEGWLRTWPFIFPCPATNTQSFEK